MSKQKNYKIPEWAKGELLQEVVAVGMKLVELNDFGVKSLSREQREELASRYQTTFNTHIRSKKDLKELMDDLTPITYILLGHVLDK